MELLQKAYAKINLTLEILGTRRGDGFHDIASVMLKVPTLYDSVTLAVSEAPENAGMVAFSCDKNVCEPEKNLAYLAAKRYYDLVHNKEEKILPGVSIALKKNIPSGAGLAGGSSDAAAVLNGLNELFGKLDKSALFQIALSLGSDIPFCLDPCGAALCTGRGEILEPLPTPENVQIELRFPQTPLSTAGIYAEYDRFYGDDYTKNKSVLLADALKRQEPLACFAALLCNDFQPLCEKRCPEIALLCEQLKREGFYAQMSGSGSAVFGLRSEKQQYCIKNPQDYT